MLLHLVASVASLIMLGAGVSVIALALRTNHAKIVDALLGRSRADAAISAYLSLPYRPRDAVRPMPRLRSPQPLRAAA